MSVTIRKSHDEEFDGFDLTIAVVNEDQATKLIEQMSMTSGINVIETMVADDISDGQLTLYMYVTCDAYCPLIDFLLATAGGRAPVLVAA